MPDRGSPVANNGRTICSSASGSRLRSSKNPNREVRRWWTVVAAAACPSAVEARGPDGVDGDLDPFGQGVVAEVREAGRLDGPGQQPVDGEGVAARLHAGAPTRRRISSSVSRTFVADRAANAWPAIPL